MTKVARTRMTIYLMASRTPRTSNRSVYQFDINCTRSNGSFRKAYLTYAQALTEIQASEAELTNALKDRRILLINGSPSS
jgi:hypothetical protein